MSEGGTEGLGFNLKQLLKVMVEKGASDLHIAVGQVPLLRIDGSIIPLKLPPLTGRQTRALLADVLTPEQSEKFDAQSELDFAFSVPKVARFRGNCFVQQGHAGAVFRFIPQEIRSFEELGLPLILSELCNRNMGLILLTGATGSGKSTTMAAMIDKINTEHRSHIMTIEDPIEFVHGRAQARAAAGPRRGAPR
jgi:twitching motility protein PilT